MTYIKVNTTSHEHITRQADSDDSWDRGDTVRDWHFNYVSIVKEDDWFDLIVPFDLSKGDTVFVVAAIYTTGDSFGTDVRAHVEYIDAFLSVEKAKECYNQITGSNTKVKWIREDGSEATLGYVPWIGYFESLDYVVCELLTVR